MNRPSTTRTPTVLRPAVLRRAAFAVLVAFLAGIAVPPVPARAGDDDKDKNGRKDKDDKDKKDKEKPKDPDPKDTKEWKALDAIGREFAAKNAEALAARIGKDAKLKIKLGEKNDGDYSATQAKGVLKGWFDARAEISVVLKKLDSLTGVFTVTVGSGKTAQTFALHAEIQKSGDGFVLTRIEKP